MIFWWWTQIFLSNAVWTQMAGLFCSSSLQIFTYLIKSVCWMKSMSGYTFQHKYRSVTGEALWDVTCHMLHLITVDGVFVIIHHWHSVARPGPRGIRNRGEMMLWCCALDYIMTFSPAPVPDPPHPHRWRNVKSKQNNNNPAGREALCPSLTFDCSW